MKVMPKLRALESILQPKMLFMRVPLMAVSSSPNPNIFLMINPIYFATKEFYIHLYYT